MSALTSTNLTSPSKGFRVKGLVTVGGRAGLEVLGNLGQRRQGLIPRLELGEALAVGANA
jgi:hypothetical protein